VVRTRAEPLGIEVRSARRAQAAAADAFGVLLQYPASTGDVRDLRPVDREACMRAAAWSPWPPTCWR
jgi:glycine cleavage system pyridoxal-binding protein P